MLHNSSNSSSSSSSSLVHPLAPPSTAMVLVDGSKGSLTEASPSPLGLCTGATLVAPKTPGDAGRGGSIGGNKNGEQC
eukprot:scaffold201654_cov27-Tisochrysis_lutea.AAC.1